MKIYSIQAQNKGSFRLKLKVNTHLYIFIVYYPFLNFFILKGLLTLKRCTDTYITIIMFGYIYITPFTNYQVRIFKK